ncbi:MAG: NAD(P)H-binding protein [Umezawaea sp.]
MILTAGANGVVGRQVMNLLPHEGTAVAAVTRGLGRTRLPDNAKVLSGDLFRPQWFETALDGVEALQISPRATGPGRTVPRDVSGPSAAGLRTT